MAVVHKQTLHNETVLRKFVASQSTTNELISSQQDVVIFERAQAYSE